MVFFKNMSSLCKTYLSYLSRLVFAMRWSSLVVGGTYDCDERAPSSIEL